MRLKDNTPISKIDCYVHFAVRSGKVLWGVDNLVKSRKPAKIVLYDCTLGQNSKKVLDKLVAERNLCVLEVPENYLNALLKRENVRVLAITDYSLANAILGYCE